MEPLHYHAMLPSNDSDVLFVQKVNDLAIKKKGKKRKRYMLIINLLFLVVITIGFYRVLALVLWSRLHWKLSQKLIIATLPYHSTPTTNSKSYIQTQ